MWNTATQRMLQRTQKVEKRKRIEKNFRKKKRTIQRRERKIG